jgi:hypothetical protein
MIRRLRKMSWDDRIFAGASGVLAVALVLMFLGGCCRAQEAANMDALRRGVCWEYEQLCGPSGVGIGPHGETFSADQVATRCRLLDMRMTRLEFDCEGYAP